MFTPDYLTDDEILKISHLLAVERVWWGRWLKLSMEGKEENHWGIRGPDGRLPYSYTVLGRTIQKTKLLIDMTPWTWMNPFTGETKSIGWIHAERILPWRNGVCPTTINWFTKRYFGRRLFGYQLYFYYMLQKKLLIVGGRGSAKTSGLAYAMASWTALHPGQPWAHAALSEAQALQAFQIILDDGSVRHPVDGQSHDEAKPSFFETFIDSVKKTPHTRINFRKWDADDPGNYIIFRALGQRQGAATTRSMQVRRASVDECTTQIDDEKSLSVFEGAVRGVNEYAKRKLSGEKRVEVDEMLQLANILDEKRVYGELTEDDEDMLKRIRLGLFDMGLITHLGSIRTGNRGPHIWIDNFLDKAIRDNKTFFGEVVSYLVNPFLTPDDRQALESTYDDPLLRRIELFALKGTGEGNWFSLSSLLRAESTEMDDQMIQMKEDFVPGYELEKWGNHLIKWQVPYVEDKIYILGADPGTNLIPYRDSWTVHVWMVDLEQPIVELVYWRWGNTSARYKGNWDPFLRAVGEAIDYYHIPYSDAMWQVGGQEAGLAQIAWTEEQKVTTIPINITRKAKWANLARLILGRGYFKWPAMASTLTVQLSNWELTDKGLVQDHVMAFIVAAKRIFDYLYMANLIEKEDKEAEKARVRHFRNREPVKRKGRRPPLSRRTFRR